MSERKILGVIPARGGSKGVPRKNIRLLAGKPLIGYSIEAAQASNGISVLTVSTEDEEIASYARSLQVSIPYMRPAALAGDTTPTLDVILDLLEYYRSAGERFDAVCLLQPTTPLRTASMITEAITQFVEKGLDSLISVLPVPDHLNPHWLFEPDAKGFLHIATGEKQIIPRRQDLPKAYYRSGDIYITSVEVVEQRRSFFGERLGYLELDGSRHVNIDTPADWNRAEELLQVKGV